MSSFALSRSFTFASLAVAGVALLASPTSARAGASEVTALVAALAAQVPSHTFLTASSSDLLAAFKTVIGMDKFNSTKEFGVVAGEALKAAGPNALDAGAVFANAINTDAMLSAVKADEMTNFHFLSLAAKTAGKGKNLNVTQIVGLSAGFVTSDADAQTAAENATNKPGAGAILGGRASQLADDTAKTTFANNMLADTKLAPGAQDLAHYIAKQVADSAAFAVHLADGSTDTGASASAAILKYGLSIALGTAAGDPTNAGNITHTLFNEQILLPNGTLAAPTAMPSAKLVTTMQKGVPKFAKSIAFIADTEEIQKVANAIGQQIATPSAANPAKGAVSLGMASSIAKTLAAGIMAKPRGTNDITDRNSDANKQDEMTELAAYLVGGLAGSPELAALAASGKASTAAGDILKIILAVTGTKPKSVKVNGVATPNGPGAGSFSADTAASVALTVQSSSLDASIKTALETLLEMPTTITKLAGTDTTRQMQVKQAILDVYSNTNTARFENGTDPAGAVSDPETDIHPFNTPGTQS
ncbi:MAG TPA: hypothetical protein VEO95_05090 [Chthoniobacteraceae bacterium]|nr:hypothetical protein [Chthoniobacteraceae bacterium]